MRIISMKKVRDIVKLYSDMGLSIRKIQGATGVAKSTVADYVKRFKELDLSLDQIDSLDDDSLRLQFFPEISSVVVLSKAMPDMNYIHQDSIYYGKSIESITLMAMDTLSLEFTTEDSRKNLIPQCVKHTCLQRNYL